MLRPMPREARVTMATRTSRGREGGVMLAVAATTWEQEDKVHIIMI